jgi:hypothetical protein
MAPLHNPLRATSDVIGQRAPVASPTIREHAPNVARQAPTATVTVIADGGTGSDSTSSLNGGAIAGIVIGSIVGFLLLIWVLRSCFNFGAPRPDVEPLYQPEPKRYHHSHRGRGHSRSPSVSRPPPVVVRRPLSDGHSHRHHHSDERGRRQRIYRS